jgi:hypothetical protein
MEDGQQQLSQRVPKIAITSLMMFVAIITGAVLGHGLTVPPELSFAEMDLKKLQ